MKSLYTDAEIRAIFEKLWEERMDLFRRFLVFTAAWAGSWFVLFYLWAATGGPVSWSWLAAFAVVEVGIGLETLWRIRRVDRMAGDVIERSELFRRMLE